jgi:hypothetical protein
MRYPELIMYVYVSVYTWKCPGYAVVLRLSDSVGNRAIVGRMRIGVKSSMVFFRVSWRGNASVTVLSSAGVSCAAADPLGEPRRRVREMGQQPSSAEGGGFASRQTAECVRVRQETSNNLLGRFISSFPTVSGQRDSS